MKKLLLLLFVLASAFISTYAQDYTSKADGNWTSTGTWNNTSGWGAAVPATGQHNSGTITVNNNITYTGNYTEGSTLTVSAGKTLTINGDFSTTGYGETAVYGNLVITGNVNLSGSNKLRIYPGGSVTINGNITINSNDNLIVGTNVAPPAYADFVVKGNMILAGSGDVTFNRNARVGIFGSVTSNAASGGTIFNVNNGAQVYVHQNMSFAGDGSHINNSNTVNPYGLYVNGTVTNSGNGSTTTTNKADKAYMDANNVPFANWLNSVPNTPLPVTLASFTAKSTERNAIAISWKTLTEINNKSFVLYRSSDAKTWTLITEITGAGNSKTALNYSFIDNVAGSQYYKLAQIDFDGTMTYSPIIVANAARASVSVFPSTALNELNIQTSEAAIQSVMIYDLSGKLMFEQTNPEATSQVRVEVQNWPKGVYVVQFPATGIAAQRFIKQ